MAEARLAHALQALQPQPAGGQEQQASPPSPQAQRHVLVAGATGVVGRAAVEEFESLGTRVTMVSRRKPAYSTTATHIALDLSDRAACDAALASLGGVTHLVYTALSGVDIAEPRAVVDNTEMLRNCLEPLEHGASASSLRHVSLMQGRKFYAGFSPEELLWPLKERHPRTDTEVNWYFTQEDLLVEHAEKASWAYTIWRPPTVLGFVPGAPLSMLTAIGVYAAVMRELGKPLCYPGGPPVAKQLCDSRLHARAFAWAADAPAARNQAYNIANCDVFIWEAAFPAIAECFGMEVGPPTPLALEAAMPPLSAVWDRVVEKHNLQKISMEDLVGNSWRFTDINWQGGDPEAVTAAQATLREMGSQLGAGLSFDVSTNPDQSGARSSLVVAGQLMSTAALQMAGFNNAADTEDCVVGWLKQMQAERYLPC